MQKLKTVDIRGKEYVPVNVRIAAFNEAYPNGCIQTEVEYQGDYVRVRAVAVPDVSAPARYFTGHAEEDRTQGNINRTNATENAETSAIGRALGVMGIGILESVASADEVAHAVHKGAAGSSMAAKPKEPADLVLEEAVKIMSELKLNMTTVEQATGLRLTRGNAADVLDRLKVIKQERTEKTA
jgi:hypothetical protein